MGWQHTQGWELLLLLLLLRDAARVCGLALHHMLRPRCKAAQSGALAQPRPCPTPAAQHARS